MNMRLVCKRRKCFINSLNWRVDEITSFPSGEKIRIDCAVKGRGGRQGQCDRGMFYSNLPKIFQAVTLKCQDGVFAAVNRLTNTTQMLRPV